MAPAPSSGPRIVEIRERSLPISRYADPVLPSGGLTTSIVAICTDVVRDGEPIVGYGFSSIGRFAQSGLIRERFAPRLLAARSGEIVAADGENLDPLRAWDVMMHGEKPGGHGERCVAVGTLDMALWDAAAKIAGQPLHAFIRRRLGKSPASESVIVYGAGGYRYPADDLARLSDELERMRALGFTRAKIKIGGAPLAGDLDRIDAAARVMQAPRTLAVDAMNLYSDDTAIAAAHALRGRDLWWLEDVCDPHDFRTQSIIAAQYGSPIAAGEPLFSVAEARLLADHGGLRPDRDILLFDPVHCYGLPGYLRIVETMRGAGWPLHAFWPHGGHLFTLHVAAALDLGGSELNPFAFAPFGGLAEDMRVKDGTVRLPSDRPGIGLERKPAALDVFETLDASCAIRAAP